MDTMIVHFDDEAYESHGPFQRGAHYRVTAVEGARLVRLKGFQEAEETDSETVVDMTRWNSNEPDPKKAVYPIGHPDANKPDAAPAASKE